MVFTSISFIYYFLPLLLICYFVVPKKFRNIILLMFSFLFLSNEYIDNAIVYDNLNKIDINVYDKSKINSWDLYDIYLG